MNRTILVLHSTNQEQFEIKQGLKSDAMTYIYLPFESQNLNIAIINSDTVIIDASDQPTQALIHLDLIKYLDPQKPTIVLAGILNINFETLLYKKGVNIIHLLPLKKDLLNAQIDSMLTGKENSILNIGAIVINLKSATMFNRFSEKRTYMLLSRNECKLFEIFIEAKGAYITREEILNKLHFLSFEINENSIDTMISRLRSKLRLIDAGDLIQTVRSRGYKIDYTTYKPNILEMAKAYAPERKSVL